MSLFDKELALVKRTQLLRKHLKAGDCFEYENPAYSAVKLIMLPKPPWKLGVKLPSSWGWSSTESKMHNDQPVRRVPRWDAPPAEEPAKAEKEDSRVKRYREYRKVYRARKRNEHRTKARQAIDELKESAT